MSNDYCFRRVAQGQLSQCSMRNTAIILRAVVKSHKVLNGTKVFACGCSGKNLKNFSKLTGKSPCWSTFINSCSLEYFIKQKPKVKVTRSTLSKKRPQNRDVYTSIFL